MKLADPYSISPFLISNLAKVPILAAPLAWVFIKAARRSARRLDWSSACISYINALKLTPNNGLAWVQLGHSMGHLGQTASAQLAYSNATLAEPKLALGHKHLGLVRYRTILREEGMQSLACALFLNPMDTELRALMVDEESGPRIETRIGVAALTFADQHPGSAYIGMHATFLRAKARKAARLRQWAKAESLYRRLAQLHANDAQIFIQLGHALNEQNKHVQAEQAYRRAVTASPLLPDTWLHLGYVLTAQSQHLLAREAFTIVNRLAPARRVIHPILESADVKQTETVALVDRRLVCPKGLGDREKAIWLRLAASIESKY